MIQINKRSIGICILLSIITCGIYGIYWMYLLVKNTRSIQKNTDKCTGEMLCLIFVPFYSLYWWYTRGEKVRQGFAEHNYNATGGGVAYLALAIFGLSIVSMAIMQSDFNSLKSETHSEQRSTFIILGGIIMYDNIGEKIKGLARATFIVEAFASVITGIVLWVDTEEWWCALILFCGPIVAWVSSWLLYGFGEIIDKLCDIEQNTRGGQSKTKIKETAERARKEDAKKRKLEAETRAKREAEEKAKREAAIEREIANIEYVDIKCPNCHEKLSFEKGNSEVQCPFCDCEFHID